MHIVLWEIGILAFLLWGVTVGFVIFSWILFHRQQQIFNHIVVRLERLDQALLSSPPKNQTHMSISKDEPILKYEKVTLPDDIQIAFVEKDR